MNISDLTPNEKNPRKITEKRLQMLKESVFRFGDLSGFVFNRRTNRLISGHQKQKTIPPDSQIKIEKRYDTPTRSKTVAEGHVIVDGERFKYREVDADETWQTEAMLAANKHGGEWDNDILKDVLANTPNINIEFAGFEVPELEPFNIDVPKYDPEKEEKAPEAKKEVDEEVPEPPKEPKSKLGDLYKLGDHRLLCGDSANVETVCRLLNGKRAQLVFTDPPYNLAGEAKLLAARGLRDSYDKLKESAWDQNFIFQKVADNLNYSLAEDGSIYICTSHFLFGEIQSWLATVMETTNYVVWAKPNPMPSLTKRHWTWATELICYGTRGKHVFNFPNEGHALSYWLQNKNQVNDLHPTQKPIAIPEMAILRSSNQGDLVVDLFGGSGSTLMACEKHSRRCFTMELSPSYVDVIISRWEKHTGKKAEKIP